MPWPIDIGGEFMHGNASVLSDLATQQGWKAKFLFEVSPQPTPGIEFDPENTLVYLRV
jgi:hypothetical protein